MTKRKLAGASDARANWYGAWGAWRRAVWRGTISAGCLGVAHPHLLSAIDTRQWGHHRQQCNKHAVLLLDAKVGCYNTMQCEDGLKPDQLELALYKLAGNPQYRTSGSIMRRLHVTRLAGIRALRSNRLPK